MKIPVSLFPIVELSILLNALGFDFTEFDKGVQRAIQCRKTGKDLAGYQTDFASYSLAKYNNWIGAISKMAVALWPKAELAAIHAFISIITHPSLINVFLEFSAQKDATLDDVSWALGDFVMRIPEGKVERELIVAIPHLVILTTQRVASVCRDRNPFGSVPSTSTSLRDFVLASITANPASSSDDIVTFYFPAVPPGTPTAHPGNIILSRSLRDETPSFLPGYEEFALSRIVKEIRSGSVEILRPELKGVENKEIRIERKNMDILAAPGDRQCTAILMELARWFVNRRPDPKVGPSPGSMVSLAKSNTCYSVVRDISEDRDEPEEQHLMGTELECVEIIVETLDGQKAAVLYMVTIFYPVMQTIEEAWKEWREKWNARQQLAAGSQPTSPIPDAQASNTPSTPSAIPVPTGPRSNAPRALSTPIAKSVPTGPRSNNIPSIPLSNSTLRPARPLPSHPPSRHALAQDHRATSAISPQVRTPLAVLTPANTNVVVGRTRTPARLHGPPDKKPRPNSYPKQASRHIARNLGPRRYNRAATPRRSGPKGKDDESRGSGSRIASSPETESKGTPNHQTLPNPPPPQFSFTFSYPTPATNHTFPEGTFSFSFSLTPGAPVTAVAQNGQPINQVAGNSTLIPDGSQFELDVRDAIRQVREKLRLRHQSRIREAFQPAIQGSAQASSSSRRS